MSNTPTLAHIEAVAERIKPYVVHTPTVGYTGPVSSAMDDIDLHIKLELLQRTGSFKPRGAVNAVLHLDDAERGITAFSAGNHAIGAAYAASMIGVPAKVVMPKTANPFRVERCRALGAEIVFGEDIEALMQIVERLQQDEGLALIHPYEGPHTVAGTATVGLELCRDVAALDTVIVPVGGGGLIAGIASAVKQMQPTCRIIGVEPEGAQGMAASLAANKALPSVPVKTIADSLGAPLHLPLTYSLVEQHGSASGTGGLRKQYRYTYLAGVSGLTECTLVFAWYAPTDLIALSDRFTTCGRLAFATQTLIPEIVQH